MIETGIKATQNIGGSTLPKLRASNSVDQNGNSESGTGMGWFPGYAIDITTGERLNMAFGENSWLNGSNGTDMIWNPTNEYFDPVGEPLLGGGHYIYVFGVDVDDGDCPPYDQGTWLHTQLQNETAASYIKTWKNCMWIMEPILEDYHSILETDVRIKLRVSHPYNEEVYTGVNSGYPAYSFSTANIATSVGETPVVEDGLSQIRIVPNPYYGYSEYETGKLDNRVKFTNLPERCTITIFNMRGGLVKSIVKDNPLTYEDWTLKNHSGIPIAGGLYLVHIEVPGVGEKVLKWYCALRQVDTDNL